jgi:hypothetical protein
MMMQLVRHTGLERTARMKAGPSYFSVNTMSATIAGGAVSGAEPPRA